MEYSIVDILPVTIAHLIYGTENFSFFKPDVSVVTFFGIVKTGAGIKNQLLTTKSNIKGIISPCSY